MSRIVRDSKKSWLKANEMPGLLDLADYQVYKWNFPSSNAQGWATFRLAWLGFQKEFVRFIQT